MRHFVINGGACDLFFINYIIHLVYQEALETPLSERYALGFESVERVAARAAKNVGHLPDIRKERNLYHPCENM